MAPVPAAGTTFFDGDGIFISGATNSTIGGVLPIQRNIIADSGDHGIHLTDVIGANTNITIIGNAIGTDSSGTLNLGGSGSGIFVDNSDVRIGSDFDGNDDEAESNTIAFFAGDGVRVNGTSAAAIRGNSMFANGGLGIDLGGDGVTANDPGDADTGPSGLQNFPELSLAFAGANTEVTGTFEGACRGDLSTGFLRQ